MNKQLTARRKTAKKRLIYYFLDLLVINGSLIMYCTSAYQMWKMILELI